MTDALPAGDRRLIAVIERMLKQVECLDEDAFLRRVNFALYADYDVVQRAAHALIDRGLHHLTIYAVGELSDRSPPTIHGCGRPPSTRWAPRWLATRSTRRTRPRSRCRGRYFAATPRKRDVARAAAMSAGEAAGCPASWLLRPARPTSMLALRLRPLVGPEITALKNADSATWSPSSPTVAVIVGMLRSETTPARPTSPRGGAPQRPRPAARPNLLCARSVGLRPLPEQLVHRGRLLHDAVLDGVVAELGNPGGVDRHRPQRQPDLSPPPRRRRGSASRTPCSC